MKKGVIIKASSRSHGDTAKVVSFFKEITGFDSIDLNDKIIGHFDYDFLNHNKDVGRRLREMNMGVISRSNENIVFDGFTMPFEKSAEYLGMTYLGHIHTWVNRGRVSDEVKSLMVLFANKNNLQYV